LDLKAAAFLVWSVNFAAGQRRIKNQQGRDLNNSQDDRTPAVQNKINIGYGRVDGFLIMRLPGYAAAALHRSPAAWQPGCQAARLL